MRINIIGDKGVGKSAFMYTFCKGEYPSESDLNEYLGCETVTFWSGEKEVTIDLKITSWEKDDKRPSVDLCSMDDPEAILVLFDVRNPHSYTSIDKSMRRRLLKQNVVILIGTKTDLREEHDGRATLSRTKAQFITSQQGFALANRINAVNYFECSARHKQGIREIFDEAVKAVWAADPTNQPQRKRTLIPCCDGCDIL